MGMINNKETILLLNMMNYELNSFMLKVEDLEEIYKEFFSSNDISSDIKNYDLVDKFDYDSMYETGENNIKLLQSKTSMVEQKNEEKIEMLEAKAQKEVQNDMNSSSNTASEVNYKNSGWYAFIIR